MKDESGPLSADDQFFSALIKADTRTLNTMLTPDFILIDVMSGSVHEKGPLLQAIGAGEVKFVSIEPADRRVRIYGNAGVVTGRTRMKVSAGGADTAASSRYTHVFVKENDRWLLASAQGTPIAEP
jgi:ketosteroid isomerase-like protein